MRNQIRILLLTIIGICLSTPALHADTVKLKDGKVYQGVEVVSEDENTVIIRHPHTGYEVISRSDILEIVRGSLPAKKKKPTQKKKPPQSKKAPKKKRPTADVIELKDGRVYRGKIVKEDSQTVMLRHPQRGYMEFSRSKISRITRAPAVKPPEEKKPTHKEKPSPGKDDRKQAQTLPERDPEAQSKFSTLLGKLQGDPPISPKELAAQLVKLGRPVVPSILRYLNEKPKESIVNVLVDVLVRFRDEKTASYLKNFLNSEFRKVRLAAVRGLQSVGDSAVTETLLRLISGEDRDLVTAAQKALTAILRRESDNRQLFELMRTTAFSAKPSTKTRILKCLGSSDSHLAVDVLLEFTTDRESSVKTAAIVSLGMLGFGESRICAAIRHFLQDEAAQVRREAALALGRLQDIESMKELISLLDDKNRGVQANTHWALKNITGLRFPPNAARWKHWWNNELQKQKADRDALLQQLRYGTRKEIVEAIDRLTALRLGKKEIIRAFLDSMTYGDTEIRVKICQALGNMKAREAVGELIEILDDPYPPITNAAHKALRAITGKDLPAESSAWKEWAASGRR